MAVTFNKDKNLKYTDMCIYIDENMPKVVEVGKYPEIESKIYEYLYHIIYALAHKAAFFKNFEDYDLFALDTAGDLYLTMRKRLLNAGKESRGKIVQPVKSCLNFIKSVLYPCKVNYQRRNFATVINAEIDPKGAAIIENNLKESIKAEYRNDLADTLATIAKGTPKTIKKILNTTPFKDDEVMMKKLYISCVLSFINSITLPTKLKEKILKKKADQQDKKLMKAYLINDDSTIVWHLDDRFKNYVTILVKRIKEDLSTQIQENESYIDLTENVIQNIIASCYDAIENRIDED